MKPLKSNHIILTFAVLICLSALNLQITAAPLGTAFTYQGRLTSGTNPANGTYDLKFTAYDALSSGSVVGGPLTNAATGVTNGLFTVALDFGGSVFTGDARWLEIGVRTNGSGSFTTLAPRQPLTPSPYALYAPSAGNAQTVINGVYSTNTYANPAWITSLAGTKITGNISGNGAGFTGSLAGDVTGTQGATVVSLVGAQTAANVASGVIAANAATSANTANTIVKRDASGNFSAGTVTLSGNLNLPATTASAGIIYSGGSLLIHDYGTMNFFAGSGAGNLTMSGTYNTGVGYQALHANAGGFWNTAIGGLALAANTSGYANTAIGKVALAANTSGSYNTAIGQEALYSNTNGSYNTALGDAALGVNTSGGGNTAIGYYALSKNTSGGGNTANGDEALFNSTTGNGNIALGDSAGYYITTGDNNIEIGNSGYLEDTNIIRIGSGQVQTFIAGISGTTVSGGAPVYVNSSGQLGTVSDTNNVARLNANQTFTGSETFAGSVQFSTDVTIYGNTRLWDKPLYLRNGTDLNHGLAWYSSGTFAAGSPDGPVLFGCGGGTLGTACGGNLIALMWNSSGNVGIGTTNPTNKLMVVNARCDGSSWINSSDRNLKQDFAPVNPQAVLAQVAALPVQTWSYKAQPNQKHLGPVAQDFHAAFGLGPDDVSIATVDESGVALAAIQGLNQKVEEQRAENAELKQRLAQLEQLVNSLTQKLNGGVK